MYLLKTVVIVVNARRQLTVKEAEDKVRLADMLVAVSVVTLIIAVLGYICIGVLVEEEKSAGTVIDTRDDQVDFNNPDAVRGPK